MSSKIITGPGNSLHIPFDSDEDLLKDIAKPFKYITSVPGKLVRQNLVEIFAQWIDIPKEKMALIKELAFYLHNGSLMIDDMQDYSELRRGVPAAHKMYDVTRTVIGVDWVKATVYQMIEEIGNFEFTQWAYSALTQILAGQGMELYWRDNYICPTTKEYIDAVYRKTGLLFVFILKSLNILCTGKPVDGILLAGAIGVYFQICDDYQNLVNKDYHVSKGFCEDISEGKFSFPVIHAVTNFPEVGKEIIEILKLRTYDVEKKKHCLSLMEKCGSFEYTKKVLIDLKGLIDREIGKLDHNPVIGDFFEKAFYYSL